MATSRVVGSGPGRRKRRHVGDDDKQTKEEAGNGGRCVFAVEAESFHFPRHIAQPALLQSIGHRQPPAAPKFKVGGLKFVFDRHTKRDPLYHTAVADPGLNENSRIRYCSPNFQKCGLEQLTVRQQQHLHSATIDLRKKLLCLASGKFDANECDDERKFVRYHYFIREGVDIVNVAPIDQSWTEAILSRLPSSLRNRSSVAALLQQIREEFLFSVKKSVIDFTIQSHIIVDEKVRAVAFTDTSHLETRRNLFDRMKNKIEKNLYKIHPTIVYVNQLWTIQYSDLRIANVKELYALEALDLNSLSEWFTSQMQRFENVIFHKWIPSVFKIVSDAIDKRYLGDLREKKANKFNESLATLMSLQLQHLCCTTIKEYTDFVCDVNRNPGFQVHVLYKSNKIIFAPSYHDFGKTLSSVFDNLLSAVGRVPRIETKLMGSANNGPAFLKPSILPDTIEQCRSRILHTLQNEWICPELRIQDFDQYICLINGQCRIEVNQFLSEERRLDTIQEKVSYFRNLGDEISLSCERVVTMGLFEIHREHFVTILANKAQAVKDRFLEKISDTYQEECKCLTEEFQNIKDTLLRPPSDTAELVCKKKYSLNLGTKVFFEMENRLRETMNKILFCSDFVPLTSVQIKRNSATFLCYKRINTILEENQNIVREKTKVFQELLVSRVEAFKGDLERYGRETNEFQNYRDAGELSKYLRKAQNLSRKFTAAEERICKFNEEEEAFGWMKTVYPEKDRLVEKLTPYKQLYENCANYKNKYLMWTEAKIGTFEPQEVEADVENFHRNIVELSQQFSAIPAPYALTNSIRLDVQQFQKHMPIVRTLGNPCLKDRHWEKISEIVGFPMRVTDDLTLAKILDYGLEEYVPKFEVISDSATKENDLEMRLNGMMAEWKQIEVELSARSGTYILASTDIIQSLLDDHIVKTQTMKSSPYIQPFEKCIRLWEEKLIFLQEMIDTWLLVQSGWLYLEPVFATNDIQHLVADECKRFNAVDKVWKDIMKQAAVDRSVMAVANIDKILERLVKCNHSLNTIQIGLSAFLEAKRTAFPRFFFLSDKEILDIVSNTRHPSGVEPFLGKCFNGAKKLNFSDDFDVVAIISSFGEELTLCEEVDTGLHRGSVEKWLARLEQIMRLSIKREIQTTIDKMDEYSLAEWLAPQTQQAIMVATALTVACQIENHLTDTNMLATILKRCADKLEQIASAAKGNSVLKTKSSLASFVIYWSHTRDILQKLIQPVHFDERMALFSMEFAYISQDGEILAQMMNRKIIYGYEYVGNDLPAVCTPLTERCFRSFFLAFEYDNAAGLQGPTGSGKTEIIENFAKMLARHLKTLNCVVGLDENLIERFFKGAASCNTWVCFDNVDVSNWQALRTIDYWLAMWRRALLFGDARTTDGLPAHRLIFLTISPAYYAQRRQLPAFTRNVVRWVSFEGGEYENVVRVKLAILGFAKANELAQKLNTLLRVCSGLFECHKFFHNDNRLVQRLVASITKLQLKNPQWSEEKVVWKGVNAVLNSMFKGRDYRVFRKVLDKLTRDATIFKLGNEQQCEKVRRLIRLSASAAQVDVNNLFLENTTSLLYAIKTHNQGVIVCGRALTGKSSLIKLAAETQKKLQVDCEVDVIVINPKSISAIHLFGCWDQATNRWQDGVFTALWRLHSRANDCTHKWHWLVMDGPVDPTWMDALNTAVDESHCLQLPSGERVPGGLNTRLILETADLTHISPTTARRCFIVHVEDNTLEWPCLIRSWLRHQPPSIAVHQRHIEETAARFCHPLLHFVNSIRCRAGLMYPATNNHLIRSMLALFDCFVDDFGKEAQQQEETTEMDLQCQLEGALIFSCIWSLGALLNTTDRCHFDIILRALLAASITDDLRNKYNLSEQLCPSAGKSIASLIPDVGTVFDYRYIQRGKGKWQLWVEAEAGAGIARDLRFDEIVVPTNSTIRNRHLISLLVKRGAFAALVGETTSAKTTAITNFFETRLDRKAYEPVSLNFTANACSDTIQRSIGCKLEKRKKGEYGPPLGIRYIIFIDDLNTVSTDHFGANSAVELLRHCIEHRRWYTQLDSTPTHLTDLQYICALTTTPSQKDGFLCARFLRHFNMIGTETFDDQTLKSMYGKIMLWHLDTRGFGKEFDPCIDQIVDATLAIHRLVRANLLPIPSKAHYIFNLRDLSRIIRGVVSSVPEAIEDLAAMKRLWVHEVLRVYQDRIVDSQDSSWFLEALKGVCTTQLKDDLNTLMRHLVAENETQINQHRLRKLIFCDFVNPKADVRNYTEVRDMDGLQSIVEGFLVEYNNVNKKPMNLLLFSYAIEHISRICRILKQPQGHALLLGEYGCGKQSLARLAIHICEYEFFEIGFTSDYGQSDWHQDVKSLLYAVFTEQHATLLLANIQILPDFMLEDVGSLLQTAQIRGVFTVDEEKEICEKMEAIDNQRDKSARTDGSREALFNMFLHRVKKQIHLVLIFHSSTYKFRRYASKYPTLVNHCTMDLFESWPAETQSVVARKLLANATACGCDDAEAVIELCARLYASAKELALDEGIDVCFTQKSFIRLVTTFRDILSKKFLSPYEYVYNFGSHITLNCWQAKWAGMKGTLQKQVAECEWLVTDARAPNRFLSTEKNLLDKAIDRLAKLGQDIPHLIEEKQKLEPLVKGHLDSLQKLEIEIETLREEETEAEISTNGARMATNKTEKQLAARKKEYEETITRMKEARENVVESLQSLTANDTAVLKAMKSPPKPVKLVAEAIAYIKDLKPEKGQESGKIAEDFWRPVIKAICDSKFVDTLIAFDMNQVPVRTLRLLEEKIFQHEEADAAKIKNYSTAAEVIFRWVRVVYDYGQIVRMDSDIRLRLDQVGQEYADARLKLQGEEKNVEEIRGIRENRMKVLEASKQQLEELRHQEATCDKKRERAEQLVCTLRGKCGRWTTKKLSMYNREKTLIGDSLLCAAILTFLTSLPENVRQAKVNEWRSTINLVLSVDTEFGLARALLDEVDLQLEKLHDQFDDPFFYDNVAIIGHSSRYVLLDDPQNALTDWLIRSQHSRGLITVRSDRHEWMRNLENAVSSGCPVLLEHQDGELDAALHPLLEKQSFKTATGFAIRMGKNIVEFDPNFRLYVCTKMEAPSHSIETYEKMTVINCGVTEYGAKNLVFNLLLARHSPNALAEKQAAIAQLVSAHKSADEAERRIVAALTSDSQILDDEAATNVVVASAQLCDDSEKRMSEARAQLETVGASLGGYASAAQCSCFLFEIAERLQEQNATNHFSFKWLENLTIAAFDAAQNGENVEKRDTAFSEIFLKIFYGSVCQSLTKTDKQVFDLLLAIRKIGRDERRDQRLRLMFDHLRRYYEKGDGAEAVEGFNLTSKIEQPLSKAENMLSELCGDQLVNDKGSETDVALHKMITGVLTHVDNAQQYVQNFVSDTLKAVYMEWTPCDMDSIYRSTNCCLPIILVPMDNASNPLIDIFALAVEKGMMMEKCVLLSPHEQTNSSLQNAAQMATSAGSWLVLSSVSLNPTYFIQLEMVLETLSPQTVHPDFRLWLILESSRDNKLSSPLTNSIAVPYTTSNATSFSRNELACRGWLLFQSTLAAQTQRRVYENLIIFETGLRDLQFVFEWNEALNFGQTETRVAFDAICHWIENHLSRNTSLIGELVTFLSDCCYGAKIAGESNQKCLAAIVRSFWTESRVSLIVDDGEVRFSLMEWNLMREIEQQKEQKATRHFIERLLWDQAKCSTRPTSPELFDKILRLKNSLPRTIDQKLLQNGNWDDDFMEHAVTNEVLWYNYTIELIESNLTNLANALEGRTFFDDRMEYLRGLLEEGKITVHRCTEEGALCERIVEIKHATVITEEKREFLMRQRVEMKECPGERIYEPRFLQFPRSLATAYLLRLDDNLELASDACHWNTYVVAHKSDTSIVGSDPSNLRLTGLRMQNAFCTYDGNACALQPQISQRGWQISPIPVAWTKKCEQLSNRGKMYACPLFKVACDEGGDHHSLVMWVLFPTKVPVDQCLRAGILMLATAESL